LRQFIDSKKNPGQWANSNFTIVIYTIYIEARTGIIEISLGLRKETALSQENEAKSDKI